MAVTAGSPFARNKYHAKKVTLDGIRFDSKKEACRWAELKVMEKAGLIKELERQVRFCLIPTIVGENGKVRQRETNYVADFRYYEKQGEHWEQVVEDAKGIRTDVYKIKKKLMLWRYGIEIREV